MLNNFYFEADIELKKEEEIKNFFLEGKYGNLINVKINYDLSFDNKKFSNDLISSN